MKTKGIRCISNCNWNTCERGHTSNTNSIFSCVISDWKSQKKRFHS